jgi:3-(methylsulfanyl)propanoyl-CoA dehydrogenase
MQFVLRELADVAEVAKLPGYEDTLDVLDSILAEAANFSSEVLDVINAAGDREGCTWRDGEVTTPPGFKDAYKQFADAGWIGLSLPSEYGGQGLPQVLFAPVLEMWNAANVGFYNGPLLNQAAIEAIAIAGSQEQKQRFIPKLVSGEWMGTMCLTEPQAGSDLAQVRCKAVLAGDHYRITGQKIFITFGEHDLAENIVHLVLARLPDAPEGTKGISLFIVPKFAINADGTLGVRNDVRCTGIEHKLGLNGNPTCTLNYGERGEGAFGYLAGEPNRGLEYMFAMMNAARFDVGVQALGLADKAYQQALAFAKDRVQGRDLGGASRAPQRIIAHPDVRRMLMWMKAHVEAMRAAAYVCAASFDFSKKHPDERVRNRHRAFVELMIPVIKGWCSETAVDICSTALQVFGGMGYVEETGIAQLYRDVRITTIYEGTTGIHGMDLVGRKLLRDAGATAKAVIETMRGFAADIHDGELARAVDALERSSQWILERKSNLEEAFACAVPYLKLWGVVVGGWQMARAARAAQAKLDAGSAEADFYRAKIATARFYATHILPQSEWLGREIMDGAGNVMALSEEQFDLDRRTMTPMSS